MVALEEVGAEMENLNSSDRSVAESTDDIKLNPETKYKGERKSVPIIHLSQSSVEENKKESLSCGDFVSNLSCLCKQIDKDLSSDRLDKKCVEVIGRTTDRFPALDAGDAQPTPHKHAITCELPHAVGKEIPVSIDELKSDDLGYFLSAVDLVSSYFTGKAITDARKEIFQGKLESVHLDSSMFV